MSKNNLLTVTGAVLSGQISLHYFEEVKHLPVFKHKVKNSLKNAINSLLEVEKMYFDKVDAVDTDGMSDKLTSNCMDFIKLMQKGRLFNDHFALMEILHAYDIEPNAIKGIADKINKKHNKIK
jgi:hypothetical protein